MREVVYILTLLLICTIEKFLLFSFLDALPPHRFRLIAIYESCVGLFQTDHLQIQLHCGKGEFKLERATYLIAASVDKSFLSRTQSCVNMILTETAHPLVISLALLETNATSKKKYSLLDELSSHINLI